MTEENVATMSTYLSFILDNEVFATDVKYVLEILDVKPVTRVPKAPDYINGVINLRGTVLPVVDLRKILNLPAVETNEETCIIVLNVELNGEQFTLGALVDAVSEVLEIDQDTIEPAPSIGGSYKAKFIEGMWKKAEDFIMLLDVNKIFSDKEMNAVLDAKEQTTNQSSKIDI